MSDIAAESVSTAEPSAPSVSTPDVSGASSTPEVIDQIGDGIAPVVAPNFDKIFGLPDEVKPPDEAVTQPQDVTEVTDPPAPRQDAEVKPEEPKAADQPEAKPAEGELAPKEPKSTFEANEKLNWDDDKVPFREEFKALKEEYLKVLGASPESQFINSPQEFSNWMKETSPTSYNQIGQLLATESAQAHPKEWIEYLAKENSDLMAEAISGREGMTVERLKAELSVLLDEDDEDVQAALANQAKAPATEKPVETEEQKAIREWREEKAEAERQKIVGEVFSPIESAVDALVSQAGLEINQADYQGKDFSTLDEETQFKVFANEIIPLWIDYRIQHDPKLRNMQVRLEEFLSKKDLASAKALQHPAQIMATNFANEVLSMVTGKRAAAKKSEVDPPSPDPPPPQVKTASASSTNRGVPALPGEQIDWSGDINRR